MELKKKRKMPVQNYLSTYIPMYFSGPNNDVVLNKRVGWIFSSPFIVENAFL
jgi:hypothetical protein